ncbi:MAG TPA: AraC family transcriptional regulator [Chitinophaga sp.]|uniref:helix-turn-helix domain-containing protein n=1 Tax=Chitinophaga sp. TaxID=1869181 RepID=UPI002DBEEB96|nr:AraC family transcriptional regulator [Chitinophaga sp.]HEU4551673.1 AraC family transcriptional regulator [Chitinophaga sp.]
MFRAQNYRPVGLLHSYVLSYQILESDFREHESREITVLPHLAQKLIFHLGPGKTMYDITNHEYLAVNAVTGAGDKVSGFRLEGAATQLVANLKPGGWFGLFRISPRHLCNRSADLSVILGPHAEETGKRIRGCANMEQQVDILQSYLLKQLSEHKKSTRNIDEAIRIIFAANGNITIRQLELAVYLTKRTLERAFLEQTGLHLKTFCRIVRFRKAIAYLQRERWPKWSVLAQKAGYSDQTHFINEFRHFAGCLPHEFSTVISDMEQVWSM